MRQCFVCFCKNLEFTELCLAKYRWYFNSSFSQEFFSIWKDFSNQGFWFCTKALCLHIALNLFSHEAYRCIENWPRLISKRYFKWPQNMLPFLWQLSLIFCEKKSYLCWSYVLPLEAFNQKDVLVFLGPNDDWVSWNFQAICA